MTGPCSFHYLFSKRFEIRQLDFGRETPVPLFFHSRQVHDVWTMLHYHHYTICHHHVSIAILNSILGCYNRVRRSEFMFDAQGGDHGLLKRKTKILLYKLLPHCYIHKLQHDLLHTQAYA